jgi:hypothetical protein
VADRFEPRPAHRDRYDLMQQQFIAAYDAVKPIAEALNR